ncbi:hypothetical protein ACFLSJ_01460 [Verrucomicrobiota bacterium]
MSKLLSGVMARSRRLPGWMHRHSEALVSAMCAALLTVFVQQSCESQRDKPDVALSAQCHRVIDLKEFPELRTSIPKANAGRPEMWRRWGESGDAAMMEQWGSFQRMYLCTLKIENRHSMPCQLDGLRVTGIRRKSDVAGLKAVAVGEPYVAMEDLDRLELDPTFSVDANGKETRRLLVVTTVIPTTDEATDLLHRQSLQVIGALDPNSAEAKEILRHRMLLGHPDASPSEKPFVISSVLNKYYRRVKIESLRFSVTDSLGRTHESDSIVLNE